MSELGLHKIPVMRTALEAIQELHKPVNIGIGFSFTGGAEITRFACEHCTNSAEPGTYVPYPCDTRRLADEALGGDTHG